MEDRVILHSDMNCFYASVEMMLNPALRGKPVAVCGNTEERHGIILAKSEPAKRAGVKTGMVNWEARELCPELILVPPQYDQYLKYSGLARSIYGRYTDLVEPFGMDECWLDVSACRHMGDGRAIAEEIRKATREELGLTVSVGVSFNKIFAKLGSDMKKPDAVTVISKENFKEKVWPLPASDVIYVGRATEKKLETYGIHTVGQLAAVPPETLRSWFGMNGLKLWHYANGSDRSRVMHKDYVSPVKSIGHGITCTADLESGEEVFKVMLQLAQDVGHRLRVHRLAARGVQIFIRTGDLFGVQYQKKLSCCTQLPSEIAKAAFELFCERYDWRINVRAITIRAANLMPQGMPEQLSLFEDAEKHNKRERVEDAVEEIRRRYGKKAITYAVLMGDLKMPEDGRDKVRMPGVMYA